MRWPRGEPGPRFEAMDPVKPPRACGRAAERRPLVDQARSAALAVGLSEEEWEAALERARLTASSDVDALPIPLFADSWTFH